MASPTIQSLRSVALNVPDLQRAETFYTQVWHLTVADRCDDAIYLRGTGPDHHILALHRGGDTAEIRQVTLRAHDEAALQAIATAAIAAGGTIAVPLATIAEPGGGMGLTVRDPDGRLLQVVANDARHADTTEAKDRPIRLAHAVFNSHDVAASQAFFEKAFGFRLSDRTKIMAFMNCNRDHHSIALGDADNEAINHIAFVMPDLESVMRGGGRMKDAGHLIEWGPGRHGPGNNAFSYFVGPFGEVIEYTAEVQQIDDDYKVGGPGDWSWPAGRIDHWGISAPPSANLKAAQRALFFVKTPASANV
jgi:catechol 2,3-dioxygenase